MFVKQIHLHLPSPPQKKKQFFLDFDSFEKKSLTLVSFIISISGLILSGNEAMMFVCTTIKSIRVSVVRNLRQNSEQSIMMEVVKNTTNPGMRMAVTLIGQRQRMFKSHVIEKAPIGCSYGGRAASAKHATGISIENTQFHHFRQRA